MTRDSANGVPFKSRMTAGLDIIHESEQSPFDEDKPQMQIYKTKDWKFELQMLHAETYHYRQRVLMYSIAYELEFMGGYEHSPAHLAPSRAMRILSRSAKHDLETLDYLKLEEPARYQKAGVGFKKLYGHSADKLMPRIASLPEEVFDCLMRRVILEYSAWVKRPEEQRKLIETCDWIINTHVQFPVDQLKAAYSDLCETMNGGSMALMQESVGSQLIEWKF